MITKGIIQEVPSGGNLFKVWIPLFDKSSNSVRYVLDAALCYNTENIGIYKVGDIVYVGFEDSYLEKPIILGKLYMAESR